MTVTMPHPRSAVSARSARSARGRSRRYSQRQSRRLSLLAAVGAVLLATGLAAPAAATTTPTPSPSPTIGTGTGTTVFTLSPLANGIVRTGDALAVSVTIQNDTRVATDPVGVTLRLGAQELPDRAALAAWLDASQPLVYHRHFGSTSIPAVASGASETNGIVVDANSPALAGRQPGVYPLSATYETATGEMTSTSVMIVPDDATAMQIGVIVPITSGARSTALLTAAELTELTSPTGYLASELDAVEGSAAILAVDPAIPAAIRVLGASAPESATLWLERLLALENERFALQYGDADPAIQIDAGLSSPLAPPILTSFMQAENFLPVQNPAPTATPTPAPTPSATVDPTVPVYPTVDELFDIGSARPDMWWPASGAPSAAALSTLGGIAQDDLASLTLLASTQTTAGSAGATVAAPARVGDATALVYDRTISDALTEASGIDDTPLRGAALTAATAHLAFAAAEVGGAPLLVALDRGTDRSRVGLRTAITAATSAPGASAVSLDDLAESPSSTIEMVDAAADPLRVTTASLLFTEETELARFATILDDVTLITGPERGEILQLLGVSWIDEPARSLVAVGEHRAQTATTLESVRLLPTSSINLFGADARLWFTVRNDLPYPVNLVLYAVPNDLRLDVQRATPIVASASSNTRVEVPVQARVGNGEVELSLQLRSRASVAIGPPETVEVSVRAEWETFGVIALSIVVGGLVLLGVIRTILRARARRAPGNESS